MLMIPFSSQKNLFAKTSLGNAHAPLPHFLTNRKGQIKCNTTSGPLTAAVLLRETPPPGAVGQRQQQEEDPTQDEDSPRAADARHRPGELVVERNRVVAGQEGQDGLVKYHQTEKHHDAWWGDSEQLERLIKKQMRPQLSASSSLYCTIINSLIHLKPDLCLVCCCIYRPDRIKQTDAGLRKKRISLLRDMVMHMAPITIRNRLNRANMAATTFRSARGSRTVL